MQQYSVVVTEGPEDKVFICIDDICDILHEVAATEETDARNRLLQLVKNLKETEAVFTQNRQTSAIVNVPSVSTRYKDMIAAAEKYFNVLRNRPADPKELAQYRNRLDELQEPFSDDPAYVAFLRSQRD